MIDKKYDSLITELIVLVCKYEEINTIQKDAEFDLKWRLTELFESVDEQDEQKFIDLTGMQQHLITSEKKREIAKLDNLHNQHQKNKRSDASQLIEIDKKPVCEKWAKSLYRRAVRRCHPDVIKVADNDHKEELTKIYKNITESYENSNLDILMIEAYKLFIKPKEVIDDQILILESSKKSYIEKINLIIASQGFVWSTFDDTMKETFLTNLMKQKGVRFVNKEKIKEVLNRKINDRKVGQRPKNKLRERVKNKK